MAAQQPGVWGIDIGQCALKAVRVQYIEGVATATAFDYVEHPKILSQPDADPDQLTREALEKFLSRNSLRGDQVAMSVPGQSGLARFVKLPPVEEKKITDIVKFEAKQQIPFALDEVVWDYQKIGSGVVTDGFAMETEIGLFAIKRETVQKAMQHFQELDIDVHLIQMAPLALCNFISYDLLDKDVDTEDEEESGKKQCVVALDIGVESTNMVITDGGRIIWQRPIPIGGNRFTRALTRELKLTFAKAEHLKRNATKSPDLKKILLALKADLNEFVNEVQKSLNFFVQGHRDAQIQYMIGMGSAFKLPGLQKFLNEKLQLEVRKLGKFNRLEGDSVTTAPVFNDNILSYSIAYGLAMQGLKRARLQTNLLPQEIQFDRTIRAKKPWAVAAAAALLIGVAGLTLGYRLEIDAVASPAIEDAMKTKGEVALTNVKKSEEECKVKRDQINHLHQQVKTIIAGQDERTSWLKIHRYINECLPRPDGKGPDGKELTSEELKRKYWNGEPGKSGKAAYDIYLARQKGGKVDATEGDQTIAYLMQLNLMNVNSLYTDNLGAYFERLKETKKDLFGMSDDDKKKPPTGAGWVVELRGYTYHPEGHNFVNDTLVANLTNRQKEKKPEEKKADDTSKDGMKLNEVDPIGGKISHVVLYRNRQVTDPVPGDFPLIKESFVASLLGVAVSKPGEVNPTATGPRSGWKALGEGGGLLKGGNIDKEPEEGKAKKAELTRSEFVVLFIWHEPTPSKKSKEVEDAAKGSTQPGQPGPGGKKGSGKQP